MRLDGNTNGAARDGIRRAAALAHERGAKLFELRAAMSAVRFERSDAGRRRAHRHLTAVLSGFSNGPERSDLVEALALLASGHSV